MWGELWNTMIWSGPAAVPVMGPLGWAFLFGAILGGAAVLFRGPLSKAKLPLVLAAIAIVPLTAIGQVTLPNTFVNGTVADADDVNENFDAILAENARYHLTIDGTEAGSTSDSKPIPPAVIYDLCGDSDGCELTLFKRDVGVAPGAGDPVAAVGERLFVSPVPDPTVPGAFRYATANGGAFDLRDNDGIELFGWFPAESGGFADCSFSDVEAVAGVAGPDDEEGFHLFWGMDGLPANSTCTLTITD